LVPITQSPGQTFLSLHVGNRTHIESARLPTRLRSERFAKLDGQYFHSVLVGHS